MMDVASSTRAERVSPSGGKRLKQNRLSQRVWESRYRHSVATDAVPERSLEETWERVAAALAGVEPTRRAAWQRAFRAALDDFAFLPGGRILAGAGAARTVTLANCFVGGTLDGSTEGVFERLKESALTMQWGGGVGCDFSPLPPRGPNSAGPVSYMRIWDVACESISAAGARRGAMMGTLRCDHPDIEEFIAAKRGGTALRNFNLSVLVTDEFMAAVAAGRKWALRYPCDPKPPLAPGRDATSYAETTGAIVRLVSARALWETLVGAAYEAAEPGVLFIDRINRANNLYYCERVAATNPCGEIPLPPHGACVLGSLNLTAFVRDAFGPAATLDFAALEALVPTAVRMLDDAIDLSLYPLDAQAEQARAARRIGLGVTGLADALIMLGVRYDAPEARELARLVLQRVRDAAYRASTELAKEREGFALFDRDAYLGGEYAQGLPASIRGRIGRHGIRNSHLLAIAPAGTISLLANNVSSGIEPVFAADSERRILDERGAAETHSVRDYAYALWCERQDEAALPPAFVTAAELSPDAHLSMLATLQPLVDNSISKTINVPADTPRDRFGAIYERAYALGAKGCTVFRPNALTGAVLTPAAERCCHLEAKDS